MYSYLKQVKETESLHQTVSIDRDRPFLLKFWTRKSVFSPATLSLKIKTITNQQRIGCLVYPEITEISERTL